MNMYWEEDEDTLVLSTADGLIYIFNAVSPGETRESVADEYAYILGGCESFSDIDRLIYGDGFESDIEVDWEQEGF